MPVIFFKTLPPKKLEISKISRLGNFSNNLQIKKVIPNATRLTNKILIIVPEDVTLTTLLGRFNTTWFIITVKTSAIASRLS